MTHISIVHDNIATQHVDAIVNAANPTLLGGGGVDCAIHAAAGPDLLKECKTLGGCKTGEAKKTRGYHLPAKYVIHTVGPVYHQHTPEKASELLASCYLNSLFLAKQYGIKTIAFPAISTGVYGFPKEDAAWIVHKTITDYISKDDWFTEIRFVLHSEKDYLLYKAYFKEF